IEVNYIDLPVRNDGMVAESDKKTPLGNDYIRHPRRGETPNIGGNCFHAGKFTNYAGKGYHGETSLSGSHNPICRSACSNYLSCAGIGNLPKVAGSTFLQDRRNALSGKKIRGSLDSLPDVAKMQVVKEELALLLQGKIELHRVAIVVDEMTQFKIHDQTEADLKDFDTAWMYLQSQIHKSWSLTAELNTEKDQIGNEIDQRQTAVFELESQITATHIQGSLSIPGFNTIDPNLKIIRDLEVEVLILKGQIADLLDQQAEIENQITETQQWITGLPEALATLEPIIFTLRQVLSGEENITSESRFGWTEAMIREKLGDLLNDHAKEALEIVRKFSPNLENLLKEADSVTLDRMSPQDRKGSAAALKFARKAMQKEADKNNRDAIANLPSNCIVPVLDILLDQQDGSFRIAYGNLTIYTKNNRHRDQLKQADFTLVLDGTETRESLAKKLECDPSEIVVIRQKTKSYKNLKIIQITGMGLLGSDRSETAKQRVAAVGAAIKEKYGCNNVGIIDHKKALDPGEESEAGYWHHDNRGSNRYKEKTALLTIGTPFQNIGHLQMLYTTMTGDCNPAKGNPAFDAFVQEFVENEMQQGGWRLRSTRRLDERLYWYIASDADLSYLKERFPDAEFEIIPAFKITPEAGSTGERMNWSILQAFKTLEETKQKITTGAIAKIVGCNRSRISQIANEVAGGFASFRKVLISLLSSLYRTVNTLAEPLTEDEQFAAKTYLPLLLEENTLDPTELVKEVVAIASTLGWKSFSCILAALNPHHRAKLLGNMLIFLPEEWHKELLEISIPAIAT
ncbi:MAG: hypothetical protein KME46_34045, partial [Brasilonema angustatum HA4187-MV1]|nr:hypothetical protein [Brasilonema angustatum HA4187-MV1]